MKMLKLIFKNALRHKLRASLTIIGIAIAVMAFGLLQTVITAWNTGVEGAAANRLVTRQAVSFIFPLPYAYKDQITKIQGVQSVTWLNWFGGVYKDKNNFFARMACDPETVLDVYPEFIVSPDQMETFKKERNSCMIGEATAKNYNIKLGDVMELDGDIYPGKWQFVVRAIYKPRDKTVDASQMMFHWNYMDEMIRKSDPSRAGNVGWYAIKISDPAQAAAISEKVDALFKNSRAETKTETERAFQQGFVQSSGAILTAINIMSYVIILIILLVLGNTMIMSARERTREYAVLKTLGFSGKHLVMFISGEALVISILGAILGILMLLPMVSGFEQAMPKGWFPIFYIEKSTYIIAALAAILVGVVSSAIPIYKAITTRIVDGLRFIG
ncbi:MAG: FtsX-like permease family protein [Candidatus Kapabacteria bacterium]|nr:FtsX-like permease family protein [Candidatus Kapabacteria bacterium]